MNRPVLVVVSTCSVADSMRPPAVSTRSTATAHFSRCRAIRENFQTRTTSASPASTLAQAWSRRAHHADLADDPDSSTPSSHPVTSYPREAA